MTGGGGLVAAAPGSISVGGCIVDCTLSVVPLSICLSFVAL